ncbi:MAG: hypothetical protein MK198_09235 [Gracilimonas sp.]|uniref:hypothetical protein n=1 Tax=Gracilimonas sp. TaxID=1974203 RepID=UPI00375012F8|nr:hypothetical protein [Gracilimonas sp.]
MKALEFNSKIRNHKIQVPKNIQSELEGNKDKNVRVIVLINDSEADEKKSFRELSKEQFLKGYDESDAIYDKY